MNKKQIVYILEMVVGVSSPIIGAYGIYILNFVLAMICPLFIAYVFFKYSLFPLIVNSYKELGETLN